jgi:Lon protease-like protein
VGRWRFRLDGQTWRRDGYLVAPVVRLDDVSSVEEGQLELDSLRDSSLGEFQDQPTAVLMERVSQFVQLLELSSAPWLMDRLSSSYGRPTRDDPYALCFWLASILPVDEHVKYALLQKNTLRERYILLCTWLRQMERHSW